MSAIIAVLYILCMLALPSMAVFVLSKDPIAKINQIFFWLSMFLLAWVASLFTFDIRLPSAGAILFVGRLNFAAIAPAATLGLVFVLEMAKRPLRFAALLWIETTLLTLASLFTGWIDKSEFIINGQHVTEYGSAFPLYIAHVVILVFAMLWVCFRPYHAMPGERREQLWFVGGGVLAMGAIGLVTNVWLPYRFGDFRFIHIGTVSTALFLAGVAGAAVLHHLFNLHVIVRRTFIFAIVIAVALEFYDLALNFLTQLLPISDTHQRDFAATFLVIVIDVLTQNRLQRWLGHIIDILIHRGAWNR